MCGPVCSQLTSHCHALYTYKQIRHHGFINTPYQYSSISFSSTLKKPFHSTFSFTYYTNSSFKVWLKLYFFCKTFSKLSPHLRTISNSFTYITTALSLHFKSKICHLIGHLLVCFPYRTADFCLDCHCTPQ